tara:strand:- start:186 stop:380 length:195 start_codon:yes stop_codon:yes gene_type:complete
MKDKIVMILAIGLMAILFFVVGADFALAYLEDKAPDDSIVVLLQNAIVAISAIVASHIASKPKE